VGVRIFRFYSSIRQEAQVARPDKAAAVAELAEEFRSSNGALLTEYRGLTVKQLQELRRALADHASYAVVKNTLTKIAAREAGFEAFEELLSGPSAIAFVKGDPVEAAKGLRDFSRANSPLVIKGGILDGKTLTVDEISRLADLESREVLLAKLAGAMSASLQTAVSMFQAPLAQVARLAGALLASAEENPSVSSGSDDDAPAAAADVDAPAAPADVDAPAAAADVDAPAAPADVDAPAAPADVDAPAAAADVDAPTAVADVKPQVPVTEASAPTPAVESVEAAPVEPAAASADQSAPADS
jgi:large subunit ribosomal protein L10